MIYWGQGLNLANPKSIRNVPYQIEHFLCDGIILYAEHLKKHVASRFHGKTFVANNTLVMSYTGLPAEQRGAVLARTRDPHAKEHYLCWPPAEKEEIGEPGGGTRASRPS